MTKALPRGRPFKRGQPRTPGSGRKRGTPNKLSRLMRELIQQATADAGGGGDQGALKYLVEAALEDRKSFLALLGRTLEKQVEITPDTRECVKVINLTGIRLDDPEILAGVTTGAIDLTEVMAEGIALAAKRRAEGA